MKYITIKEFGGIENLAVAQTQTPAIEPKQLLIEVHATGVNRADLLQREGRYPPPMGESEILGLEIAGIVVNKGDEVTEWELGDRVFGLVPGGGYAEFCALDAHLAVKIPNNMDFITAAGIAETFMTANETLMKLGGLCKDETVLIHAAASGVGTTAIQMANHLGAKIIATAGSDEKCQRIRQLGVDLAINYKQQKFYEVIAKNSVDLVLDFIGRDYFPHHLDLLKKQGRLVQIATMSGAKAEINLVKLMQKRLTVQGFVLRSQALKDKRAICQRFVSRWYQALCEGEIAPVIDKVFPLDEVEQAHAYMQENKNIGKIILSKCW